MTGANGFARWLPKQGILLDELLVAEPTLCKPVIGHKGDVRMYFDIQGKAAHSSMPELGQNAIAATADLIKAIEAEHERLQGIPAITPLGQAKLTLTVIEAAAVTMSSGHLSVMD